MEKIKGLLNRYGRVTLWAGTFITLTTAFTLLMSELYASQKSLAAALNAATLSQVAPNPTIFYAATEAANARQISNQVNTGTSSAETTAQNIDQVAVAPSTSLETSNTDESEAQDSQDRTNSVTDPSASTTAMDSTQFTKLQSQIDDLRNSFAAAIELIKQMKESSETSAINADNKKREANAAPPASAESLVPKKREFKIIGATPEFLVIADGEDTKKVHKGAVLPNGATFVKFDGQTIVTSIGTYPVR